MLQALYVIMCNSNNDFNERIRYVVCFMMNALLVQSKHAQAQARARTQNMCNINYDREDIEPKGVPNQPYCTTLTLAHVKYQFYLYIQSITMSLKQL